MDFIKSLPRWRSTRLQTHSYSDPGTYFITLCTQNKSFLFGEIIDEKMQLNEIGKIVLICWNAIPTHFLHVELNEFVVMPNHIHGIIILTDFVGANNYSPANLNHPTGTSRTIGSIVRGFKIGVTKKLNINFSDSRSKKSIWQRNYWEHIIRGEQDLNRIREYILNNPSKWELDSLNPHRI